ncbi:MAG: 2-isopropylmalate synthase [Desulfovibrionaceae bacterium]|nr:2-isopropylmalate synthase [Desulfovibrionaceae bacterium]
MERVVIFDTTLRDGEQSPGATMNRQEKLRLARQLERLGVDVMEAGFPAASPGDFAAVSEIARAAKNVSVAALARAVKSDVDCACDALAGAVSPRVHVFIAGSELHMREKLRKTPREVLAMAEAAVSHAASRIRDVEFSVEDASRADPAFLAELLAVGARAGAGTLNIADTVGYAQPDEFAELLRFVMARIDGAEKLTFGVHCHNDLGLAVANTLAALRAGARQAEVTLCGLGERAGNASLEEVVMALKVRQDVYGLATNVRSEKIFPACRLLSMILGRPIPATKPVVGGNAFAHESGIHQDGVLKNRGTYEIMTPESIGRADEELVIGKHSGRAAVRARLEALGYLLDDAQLDAVFAAVKRLADQKNTIHDEDLEAMVFSEVYRLPDRYRLVSVSVQSANGAMPAMSAVAVDVHEEDGSIQHLRHAGFGVGPIDATFNVLSELLHRSPHLEQFAINAITGGTDALGEVTVHLRENGVATVGRAADPDVIRAAAKAFVDALNRYEQKTEFHNSQA